MKQKSIVLTFLFVIALFSAFTQKTNPIVGSLETNLFKLKNDTVKDIADKCISDTSSNYIYYTIYTDFQGFSGDNPNGLIQSELFADFKLRKNVACLAMFRNVAVGMNLTKLEDNLRYKQLNYFQDSTMNADSSYTLNPSKPYMNYLDLVRYQNFEAFAKLNLVTLDLLNYERTKQPVKIYLDGFINIISTGVRDTTLGDDKKETDFSVSSLGYGFSGKVITNFIRDKKFPLDFDGGFTWYQMYNMSNNFVTSDGPLFQPETNPRNNEFFNETAVKGINRYHFVLSYCRDYEKAANRIFLRLQLHTVRVNKDFEALGFKHNSYLQVQLGYSASFEDLFPEKTKKDNEEKAAE